MVLEEDKRTLCDKPGRQGCKKRDFVLPADNNSRHYWPEEHTLQDPVARATVAQQLTAALGDAADAAPTPRVPAVGAESEVGGGAPDAGPLQGGGQDLEALGHDLLADAVTRDHCELNGLRHGPTLRARPPCETRGSHSGHPVRGGTGPGARPPRPGSRARHLTRKLAG